MIQLKGEKTILLLKPEYINNFKEYPLLHPANRNFQIKSIKENDNVKEFIQEYILQEGDGLFIPKYWIHEIKTETESMSLVITYKNEDLEKIAFFEIGKDIDDRLYNINGMKSIFDWNKSWLYKNTYPPNMKNIYTLFCNSIIHNFPLETKNVNIDTIFHNHAKTYEIFFNKNKDEISIPRF